MRNQPSQITRTESQLQFLYRLNQTQLSGSRLMHFAEAVHSVPKVERDFEGIAITAIKFFSGDPDAALSAFYRMQALADIVTQGVPGWAAKKNADGAIKTHPALFGQPGERLSTGLGTSFVFGVHRFYVLPSKKRRLFRMSLNDTNASNKSANYGSPRVGHRDETAGTSSHTL